METLYRLFSSFNIYVFGIYVPYAIIVVLFFIFIFTLHLFKKGREIWMEIITLSYGFILIGGLFAQGKTRMLTMIAFLWKKLKKDVFIISNFDNEYSDIQYSSLNDFVNILNDLIFLGDYQNFSENERKNISHKFKNYFDFEKIKEFKKKYKYIPTDGYNNNFLLLGDEFHQYFYNRGALVSFIGEKGKNLLQTLHQIRHYNCLAILATQELDELDVKFRKLASFELETESTFFDLIIKSNIFKRNKKLKYSQENILEKEYRKINKKPIMFFNFYKINKILMFLNKILFYFYKKIYNYQGEFFKIIPLYEELKFKSKFNVKLDIDTYNQGDIFNVINEFYKRKEKKVLTNN